MKCKLDKEVCTGAIVSKRKCNFIQVCYGDKHWSTLIYFFCTSWFYSSISDFRRGNESRNVCHVYDWVFFRMRNVLHVRLHCRVDILHRNRLKWIKESSSFECALTQMCDLYFQFSAKPSKNNRVNIQKKKSLGLIRNVQLPSTVILLCENWWQKRCK